MMHDAVKIVGGSGVVWGLSLILGSYHGASVLAQPVIKGDQTLRSPTQVTRRNNQFVITGGTQKGGNLFHSFRDFSISKGQSAIFPKLSPDVRFVINRVTGPSPSRINGGIRLLGPSGRTHPASLILLNPRGIEFGSHALLDLGGSFIASTAQSLQFRDGKIFKAELSDNDPLLTISVPQLFAIGPTAQGIKLVGTDPSHAPQLKVQPQQAFILIGGEIQLDNYQLGSFIDARVELASLSSNESVELEASGIPQLNYAKTTKFLDSGLNQQSSLFILATKSRAKSHGLYIHSNRLTLENEAWLRGTAPISIDAKALDVFQNSDITSVTPVNQKGAPIIINVDSLHVDQSIIQSVGGGRQPAGDFRVDAKNLTLTQGGQLFASSTQGGIPSVIQVNSEIIEVEGGLIREDLLWRPSGIFSRNRSDRRDRPVSKQQAEAIEVTTQSLSLKKGAQISALTFNTKDAGDVAITAQEIDIEGDATNPDGSLFLPEANLNIPISSGIFTSVDPDGSGKGGNLRITTNRLSIRQGGNIQAATFGRGDAGKIDIKADLIAVTGQDIEGRFPSTIFAGSGGIPGINGGNNQATGSGNDINLTTRTLLVSDGAAIAVGSLNPNAPESQKAGNLNVFAEKVVLENDGQLISNTSSGNGGTITLTGYNNAERMQALFLIDSGQISSTAGLEQAGGDGGNIRIDSDSIVANQELRPNTLGSDISANAFNGSGGNINLNTDLLIGIQPRAIPIENPRNQLNDLDASSQLGTPGSINISANIVDPTQTLVKLPASPRSPKVARQCDRQIASESSRFVNLGKGGLAKSPVTYAQVNTSWEDLRVASAEAALTSVPISTSTEVEQPNAVMEAQGLMHSKTGQLMLVAQVPKTRGTLQATAQSCVEQHS